MSVCAPTVRPSRFADACPLPSRVTVARVVAPSRITTEPVGTPAPGATAATVTSITTVVPNTDGSGVSDAVTFTVAGFTVWARPAEVLPVKPAAPLYWAVSVRDPVAMAPVVSDATPAPSTAVVPSTVVPSRKVTVPVGVLGESGESTVAVSVTGSPNVEVADDAARPVLVDAAFTVCATVDDELAVKPAAGE